ncbi:hypothetical protein HDV05_001197, partial [Chytridiales sp. JEL 0842]
RADLAIKKLILTMTRLAYISVAPVEPYNDSIKSAISNAKRYLAFLEEELVDRRKRHVEGRDGSRMKNFSGGMYVLVKRNPTFMSSDPAFEPLVAHDEGISVMSTVVASNGDVYSCGPQVGHDLANLQNLQSWYQEVWSDPDYKVTSTKPSNGKARLAMQIFLEDVHPLRKSERRRLKFLLDEVETTQSRLALLRSTRFAAASELQRQLEGREVEDEGGGGEMQVDTSAEVEDEGGGGENEEELLRRLTDLKAQIQELQTSLANDCDFRQHFDSVTEAMSTIAVELRKRTSRLLASFKVVASPQFDMGSAAKKKKSAKMSLPGVTKTAGLVLGHATCRTMMEQQIAHINMQATTATDKHRLVYVTEECSTMMCPLCRRITKVGASKVFRCSYRHCRFTAPRDEKGGIVIMSTFAGSAVYNGRLRTSRSSRNTINPHSGRFPPPPDPGPSTGGKRKASFPSSASPSDTLTVKRSKKATPVTLPPSTNEATETMSGLAINQHGPQTPLGRPHGKGRLPDSSKMHIDAAGNLVDEAAMNKPKFNKRPQLLPYHLAAWVALTIYMALFIVKAQGKFAYEFTIFIYVLITLRLLAQHISLSHYVFNPISSGLSSLYNSTIGKSEAIQKAPSYLLSVFFMCTFFVILIICAFATPASELGTLLQRFQSILGLFFFLLVLFWTSKDRRAIKWHTVSVGLNLQLLIGLFVLKTQLGLNTFQFISKLIVMFLEESQAGFKFLLGGLVPVFSNKDAEGNLTGLVGSFALSVLPAILFFCSFIAIVYYIGGMQYIITKFAWVMVRLMDTSGAESVVAAASPFVGQGESALLVKPFVAHMTMSELHATMTSGFATIAGSILLALINFTGNSPASTSALLTSCVMSIPCSLLVSKMRYPEKEQSLTKGEVKVPESEEDDANVLHAAGNGAAIGVQLVLLIAGSLLAIVSLYSAADNFVKWFFDAIDIRNIIDGQVKGEYQKVTIDFCLSWILIIPALAIGISPGDKWIEVRKAGAFMAQKLVANEFVAYDALNQYAFTKDKNPDGSSVLSGNLSPRTVRLLTFALCGFANFASIGIQIGCLGAMAPNRKADLAKIALSAML